MENQFKDYRYIIEQIQDYAILLLDKNGIINDWNKGAEKIKGYKAQEIIGKHFRVFYTANDRENNLPEQLIAKAIANGSASHEGYRMRKDGTTFWGSIVITAIFDQQNNLTGFLKITRDLTDKKELEEKLKKLTAGLEQQIIERTAELQKQFKETTDYKYAINESTIVAITDQRGVIKHANDNFCKISKYSKEELIGQDHRIINSGYHPKEFIRNLWTTISKGKIWKGELRNKAKDGTLYWVDTTIVPFLDEAGKPYQYLAIRADITERKIMEEKLQYLNLELEERVELRTSQLASVNKELESFSYSVSHDLRAPLRAIHGYSQILKEDYAVKLDHEALRLTNNIMYYAKKMGMLIDDLLAFSRLGRKELVKKDADMHKIVTVTEKELKREQENREIEFHIGKLIAAQADEITIKQVWVNLISNALKYTRQKPKTIIEIESEENENEVIYSVKDNGVGFDMRYADKLFGVFQRLHSDKEFEGTGVGLAIVQRIISKHGGRVWAEGKVNEGATFYFTLSK